MTQINISEPSEPNAESGYYRIEVIEHGELIADIDIAASHVPEVEEPSDLYEIGGAMQQVAEQLEGVEGV
jgi:hypothetical protein